MFEAIPETLCFYRLTPITNTFEWNVRANDLSHKLKFR